MIKVLPTQPGRYLAGGTACSHGLQRQHRHQAQRLLPRRDAPNCRGELLPKWLGAAPSHPPSAIHLRCRDKTLEKTLTKKGLRQRLPAATWQAEPSRSSNPPMSPADHPVMLLPSCLSLPFCQRNLDHTPCQQGPGQCWHDTMTMDTYLLSSGHSALN